MSNNKKLVIVPNVQILNSDIGGFLPSPKLNPLPPEKNLFLTTLRTNNLKSNQVEMKLSALKSVVNLGLENVANNTISTRSKQFFNSTRQSPKTLTERSIDKIKDKKDRYAAHAFGNNKLESIERNLRKTFLLRKEGSVQRLEFN